MFIFRNPDDVHELDILPLFFDSNKMLLLMKGPSVLDTPSDNPHELYPLPMIFVAT